MLDDERHGRRLASQGRELALACEDHVRLQLLEPREQLRRPEVPDPASSREVDADAPALRSSRTGRAGARLRDRPAEQRVAGEVEDVTTA